MSQVWQRLAQLAFLARLLAMQFLCLIQYLHQESPASQMCPLFGKLQLSFSFLPLLSSFLSPPPPSHPYLWKEGSLSPDSRGAPQLEFEARFQTRGDADPLPQVQLQESAF